MRRILIVDDDEGFRDAIGAALRLEGFSVDFAANGREALDFLSGAALLPQVVLVDLMMPVMSGWELLDAMQSEPALAGIPAAVVSAARDPGRIPTSVVTMKKPIDLLELLRFLERTSA